MFSGSGTRQVTSPALSDVAVRGGFVSFDYVVGGSGAYPRCEKPDSGENFIVEYSTGSSSYYKLWTSLISSGSSPLSVTLTLPVGTKFVRWRQLRHSGQGMDEWMIDQV